MGKRDYFYRDSQGKIQQFIYCTSCLGGPFTQEDIDRKVFIATSIKYCVPCAKMHAPGLLAGKTIDDDQTALPEAIQFKTRKAVVTEQIQPVSIEAPLEIEPQLEELEKIEKEIVPLLVNEPKQVQETKQTIKAAFIVFVVLCKDKTYYCSSTAQELNLAIKRINQASGPKALRTPKKRPVTLVETKEASSVEEVLKIKKELQIKYKI